MTSFLNGFDRVLNGFYSAIPKQNSLSTLSLHKLNKRNNIARSNQQWRLWVMTSKNRVLNGFDLKMIKNGIFNDFGQKSQKSTPFRAKHEKMAKMTRSKWLRKSRFFTFPGGTPGNFEFLTKKSIFDGFLVIFWWFSSKIDQNLDFEGSNPLKPFDVCL